MVASLLFAGDSSGAVLVYQHGKNSVVAARADGSGARKIARGFGPSVSPAGRLVAFFRRDGHGGAGLFVSSVKGGSVRFLARPVFYFDLGPPTVAWSPDSRRLIVGDDRGESAFLIDVRRATRRSLPLESSFAGASFSPSGTRFAIVDDHPKLAVLEVRGVDSRYRREVAEGGFPAWGRPGIAFKAERAVELQRGPGRPARMLVDPADSAFAYPIGWSASGGTLLVAEGETWDHVNALLVNPSSAAARQLPQRFHSINGVSRGGGSVLGEISGNVVSVGAGGKLRVLARNATAASWTR